MSQIRETAERHSYAMTIAYGVGSAASGLIGILAFLVRATAVGIAFGIVLCLCIWQEHRWRASTGHEGLGRSFAFDAAEKLHTPIWPIQALLLISLGILAIVG
jgi:hypothetical protein